MVPQDLKDRVWATYVEGQEIRKDPTEAWHQAADAAIDYVARAEGRKPQFILPKRPQ